MNFVRHWSFPVAVIVGLSSYRVGVADDLSMFKLPRNSGMHGWIEFSPDGRWLAMRLSAQRSSRPSGSLLVWDTATQRLVATIDTGTDLAGGLDWSRDGTYVVTGGSNRCCTIWSVNPKPSPKRPFLIVYREFVHYPIPRGTALPGVYGMVCFSPTTDEVASINCEPTPGYDPTAERSLKIWRYIGLAASIPRSAVAPMPSGAGSSGSLPPRPATAANGAADPNAPRLTIRLTPEPHVMAYSPDGKLIAVSLSSFGGSANNDVEVHLYEVSGGERVHRWSVPGGAEGFNRGNVLKFSPDGKWICLCAEKVLVVWDVASKVELWRHSGKAAFGDAAFSAEHNVLALSENDANADQGAVATIRVYRLPGFAEISTGRRPANGSPQIAFTPDGRRLVTGWNSTSMRLWNVGELVASKNWGSGNESK